MPPPCKSNAEKRHPAINIGVFWTALSLAIKALQCQDANSAISHGVRRTDRCEQSPKAASHELGVMSSRKRWQAHKGYQQECVGECLDGFVHTACLFLLILSGLVLLKFRARRVGSVSTSFRYCRTV
jgi:hypothetical protein